MERNEIRNGLIILIAFIVGMWGLWLFTSHDVKPLTEPVATKSE